MNSTVLIFLKWVLKAIVVSDSTKTLKLRSPSNTPGTLSNKKSRIVKGGFSCYQGYEFRLRGTQYPARSHRLNVRMNRYSSRIHGFSDYYQLLLIADHRETPLFSSSKFRLLPASSLPVYPALSHTRPFAFSTGGFRANHVLNGCYCLMHGHIVMKSNWYSIVRTNRSITRTSKALTAGLGKITIS